MLEDFEKIFAQENLAAAQGQEEDAGVGDLIEQILDLGGGHLAMIVVIEIAVHAALVAAVGQIELRAERDVQLRALADISSSRPLIGILRRARRWNWFFRNLQDLVAGQFARQSLSVLQGLGGLDLEFRADALLDDFVKRRGAVGGLPQDGGGLVQSEESGVARRT